jgi:Flp pilus assembly protein TadG
MLRGFAGDRRALAALEFVLVAPLMVMMLAGVYDLSEAALVYGQAYDAAHAIVASASLLAVQSNGSNNLTYQQVQMAESLIWVDMPALRAGLRATAPMSVTLSSVTFEPPLTTASCTYGQVCQYDADVIWSVAYTGGDSGASFQTQIAPCNLYYASSANQVNAGTAVAGANNVTTYKTLGLATNTATFADTGNSVNEAGVVPFFAATVQISYTPLFNFFIKAPITFWVSADWPIRTANNIAAANTTFMGNAETFEPLNSQFATITASSLASAAAGTYCTNASETSTT